MGAIDIPDTGLSPRRKAVHALRRLGYGPRPGEPDRVVADGVAAWVDRQLQPDTIDESELEARLDRLPTHSLDTLELIVEHPPPQLLRGIDRRMRGRDDMDPEARSRMRRARGGQRTVIRELSHAKLLRAIHAERQLLEVMTDFWFNHFNVFMGKGSMPWLTGAYEREAIRPHALGRFRDLVGATAAHPAMLFYLDNWLSSASGGGREGRVQATMADAARRDGLGPGGVVPAILRRQGSTPPRMPSRMIGLGGDDRRRGGLNENYARELMELHALGVDGGYTQEDIVEVARCFTGWTLLPLPYGHGFVYVDGYHERGPREVLGQRIPRGQRGQGEEVLDRLARHPSTARMVGEKLARRFVRDDPPGPLVESLARTFRDTDGDIAEVLGTLFRSTEFWSPASYAAKLKTPLELVASMARAAEAEVRSLPIRGDDPGLVEVMHELGQPLYLCQPPTGYDDVEEAWVSAGSLLARMKVGIALGSGNLAAVTVRTPSGDPLVTLAEDVLGEPLPGATVERLDAIVDPRVRATPRGRKLALGWLLASPEFQRR